MEVHFHEERFSDWTGRQSRSAHYGEMLLRSLTATGDPVVWSEHRLGVFPAPATRMGLKNKTVPRHLRNSGRPSQSEVRCFQKEILAQSMLNGARKRKCILL
jgi:hypothetical protein